MGLLLRPHLIIWPKIVKHFTKNVSSKNCRPVFSSFFSVENVCDCDACVSDVSVCEMEMGV